MNTPLTTYGVQFTQSWGEIGYALRAYQSLSSVPNQSQSAFVSSTECSRKAHLESPGYFVVEERIITLRDILELVCRIAIR